MAHDLSSSLMTLTAFPLAPAFFLRAAPRIAILQYVKQTLVVES